MLSRLLPKITEFFKTFKTEPETVVVLGVGSKQANQAKQAELKGSGGGEGLYKREGGAIRRGGVALTGPSKGVGDEEEVNSLVRVESKDYGCLQTKKLMPKSSQFQC